MDFVFFHNPDEENGYLSNWYISQFTIHDMSFSSMEQYMMYMKAKYFHDHEIAEKILSTDNPATIKALGREVCNYNESYWNGIRQIIIYEGLLAKFSQNEQLKIELLNTQETILAECAVIKKGQNKFCPWRLIIFDDYRFFVLYNHLRWCSYD